MSSVQTSAEIPEAYREDLGDEAVPHKVNIYGVDELSTENLQAFASEHFPAHKPKVEWINDSSVNFVYDNPDIALQALLAFSNPIYAQEGSSQERATKPVASHPGVQLQARVAKASDRKKPRAREASRYYLLHPEEESRNRRQSGRGRRRSEEEVEKFDASMYDDDPTAVAGRMKGREIGSVDRRRNRDRDRSRSPGRSASPGARSYGRDRPLRRRNSGKELFAPSALRAANNKAAAGNLKKELFPMRTGTGVEETTDLFSSNMTIPAADGAADGGEFPLRSDAMFQKQKKHEDQGFSIKGSAGVNSNQGFSIRGAAGQKTSIKELFPSQPERPNAGKELFTGRAVRRSKAADLFG